MEQSPIGLYLDNSLHQDTDKGNNLPLGSDHDLGSPLD